MASNAIPPAGTCLSCKAPLELVFEEGKDKGYQYDNALWVGFFGGYGMFIDSDMYSSEEKLGGATEQAVICHECAHELCDKIPWVAELLDPLNSHAHSVKKDWTGHVGWDLPHY